jgi:hypothetical protein
MKLVKQWVVEGGGSGLPTIQELNALRGKKICLPLISRKVFQFLKEKVSTFLVMPRLKMPLTSFWDI